jgi:hypothetical protein
MSARLCISRNNVSSKCFKFITAFLNNVKTVGGLVIPERLVFFLLSLSSHYLYIFVVMYFLVLTRFMSIITLQFEGEVLIVSEPGSSVSIVSDYGLEYRAIEVR